MCQQSQGSWYQAGIVSFGIGCAEKDVPAVYADVAYAACWIDQEVGHYFTKNYNHQLNHVQVSNYSFETDSYFGYTKKDCPDNVYGLF